VRPLRADDRAQWELLWAGYLAFYRHELPDEITELTWRRLLDPAEPLHGLGAEINGVLVGFAHILLHRSTWARDCYCYLEDLFVADHLRGHGVGRALIAGVEASAREAGASRLYWVTDQANARAQVLYNDVAERTPFIQYRKTL
jgi:GNAT superfamily N-acetyltransferase